MGLKEKLIHNKEEERLHFEEIAQRNAEEHSFKERITVEKKIEIDNLALIAEEKLKPFLDVVNEIELDNEGKIEIKKGGPFLDGNCAKDMKEIAESYAEIQLSKQLWYNPGSDGNLSSSSNFRLRLRIRRSEEVVVMGYNAGWFEEYTPINLNDECFIEKIENEIFSILQTKKCIYDEGGRIDRSI